MDPTRVSVAFAILADAAQAVAGKLHVLGGGWDVLRVGAIPAVHHTMAIGMRISVPWTEMDREVELSVMLIDEDGHPLFDRGPVRHTFTVRRPPGLAEGFSLGVVRALTLNNIQLPKEGGYSFAISIDGEEIERLPFRVLAARPRGDDQGAM